MKCSVNCVREASSEEVSEICYVETNHQQIPVFLGMATGTHTLSQFPDRLLEISDPSSSRAGGATASVCPDQDPETRKLRVLLVTGGQGRGHRTPAGAVFEALERKWSDEVTAEIVDARVTGLKRGTVQDLRYRITNSSDIAYALYRKSSKSKRMDLRRAVEERVAGRDYDVIFGNHADSFRHAAKLKPETPFVFLSADPGGNHRKWQMDRLKRSESSDVYLIHSENKVGHRAKKDARREAINRGVPQDRIFCDGAPIRSEFAINCAKSKIDCREIAGLPQNKRILLITAGAAQWAKNCLKKVDEVLNSPRLKDVLIIVVAGKNVEFRQELNARAQRWGKDRRIIVKAECTAAEMAILAKASDVVASKAGGSSMAEMFCAQTPLIVHEALSGIEHDNAKFAVEQGLAVDGSKGNFVDHLSALFDDKDRQIKIVENLSRHYVPNSAEKIADRLVSVAREKLLQQP